MAAQDVREVEGPSREAVSPGAGAGLGASGTAPNLPECVSRWLLEHRGRIKEFMLRNGYERFYPISDLQPPVSALKRYCIDKTAFRDAKAIWEIFAVEASSAYALFIEFYVNATPDLIEDDFKRDVELVKRVLREYEREYMLREKLIITRSRKHIYIKNQEGKIILYGDTYPIKDVLKQKGFKWDPLYKVWFISAKNMDLDRLMSELEVL
jgi:hypothetical protein